MKEDERFNGYKSYIMADYVHYISGSGARIVPIIYGEDSAVTTEKI